MLDTVKRYHSKKTFLITQYNSKSNAVKEQFMNILDSTKKRSGKIFMLLVLLLCIPANLLIACNDVSKTNNPSGSEQEVKGNNFVTTSNEGITSANVASVNNDVKKDPLIEDGTIKTLKYKDLSYEDGVFPDNELAETVESSVQFYWDLYFKHILMYDNKSRYETVQSDKLELRYYYPSYTEKIPSNDAFISLLKDKFTDGCIQEKVLKNNKYRIMQDGTIGISEGDRGTDMTYVYKQYEIVTKTQDIIEANIVAWYYGENDKDLAQADNYRNLKKDVPIHSKTTPLILKRENGKWKIDQITIWN